MRKAHANALFMKKLPSADVKSKEASYCHVRFIESFSQLCKRKTIYTKPRLKLTTKRFYICI